MVGLQRGVTRGILSSRESVGNLSCVSEPCLYEMSRCRILGTAVTRILPQLWKALLSSHLAAPPCRYGCQTKFVRQRVLFGTVPWDRATRFDQLVSQRHPVRSQFNQLVVLAPLGNAEYSMADFKYHCSSKEKR